MARAWTEKGEKQYQTIKDKATERRRTENRAEEIASKTVDNTGRMRGFTPNKRTQENPRIPLESRPADELHAMAEELRIPHQNEMTKEELIEAIRAVR